MIKTKVSFKFDSTLISKYMDAFTAKAMRRIGGYLRTVARRSMRKRKSPSRPGSPPSAHENPLLKTFLEYAFDPIKRRLVVGPKMLPRSKDFIVPELMEKGGTVLIRGKRKSFQKTYPARPFMLPALEKQANNLLMNSLRASL